MWVPVLTWHSRVDLDFPQMGQRWERGQRLGLGGVWLRAVSRHGGGPTGTRCGGSCCTIITDTRCQQRSCGASHGPTVTTHSFLLSPGRKVFISVGGASAQALPASPPPGFAANLGAGIVYLVQQFGFDGACICRGLCLSALRLCLTYPCRCPARIAGRCRVRPRHQVWTSTWKQGLGTR